jgi:hypothetical protein
MLAFIPEAFTNASKSFTRVSQTLNKTSPTGANFMPRLFCKLFSTVAFASGTWTLTDGVFEFGVPVDGSNFVSVFKTSFGGSAVNLSGRMTAEGFGCGGAGVGVGIADGTIPCASASAFLRASSLCF